MAVKKFNFRADEMTLKAIHREIAILRKVSYDGNVVQFYGACLTATVMVCMEYMEVNDCHPRMIAPSPRFPGIS